MTVVSWIMVTLAGMAVGLYLSDRKGWNATAKRLSKIVRASIESHKPIKELESKHVRKQEKQDLWEFDLKLQGKNPDAPQKKKHFIVKTDYYASFQGPWPQWTCNCGLSKSEPLLLGMGATRKRARRAAADHVKSMNRAEEKRIETGGSFHW